MYFCGATSNVSEMLLKSVRQLPAAKLCHKYVGTTHEYEKSQRQIAFSHIFEKQNSGSYQTQLPRISDTFLHPTVF